MATDCGNPACRQIAGRQTESRIADILRRPYHVLPNNFFNNLNGLG